ncbi:LysE family translocator (plasmid) [Pseudoalteromonas xiamenensis]|uniref:LysE family translocator n=1 Tax=Pseudoalteromonas xiamenensis TaxID=882626 RepID=UPI0027E428B5|nr:LysE family translocator [Pseudoalteromonas xiamenensis]WMN62059.1 LysE family translocator [Pseudoalteromonas xiamenensis]
MNIEQYVTYAVVITVLFLSPGPSVLLAVNNGMNHGRKAAGLGVLGNVAAFQLLLIISATGLGTVMLAWSELLVLIKVIGASYLCYLGIKLFRTPVSQSNTDSMQSSFHHQPWLIFKQAFWVTLLNPKALIFVSALLPQFISPTFALVPQVVTLCIVSSLIHFTIYFGYAALASQLKQLVENEEKRRRFNKMSGFTFLLFGMAMLGSVYIT